MTLGVGLCNSGYMHHGQFTPLHTLADHCCLLFNTVNHFIIADHLLSAVLPSLTQALEIHSEVFMFQ